MPQACAGTGDRSRCNRPTRRHDTEWRAHVGARHRFVAKLAEVIGALAPQVVVHCAGPYQGQDYRVAEAALACGAHYIDLADGREFVVGFGKQVDAAARAAGCVAITCASSVPALSSAVIDHLGERFSRTRKIGIAIAPGQRAPRGTATMPAVLGYAGEPFQWWKEGEWRTAHGWQELCRIRFPYGVRCAAACDVPDLQLLPQRYADAQTVTFHAALELAVEHYALWSFAGLRRLGVRLPMQRWARVLNRIGGWLDRFGSDCGGMRIGVAGEHAIRRFAARHLATTSRRTITDRKSRAWRQSC